MDAYKIHLHLFLHKTDLRSKDAIIANVVHLTNIEPGASREELEATIAETLEVDRADFMVIMYPKVEKLCRYETKLDELREQLGALEQPEQARFSSLVFRSRGTTRCWLTRCAPATVISHRCASSRASCARM